MDRPLKKCGGAANLVGAKRLNPRAFVSNLKLVVVIEDRGTLKLSASDEYIEWLSEWRSEHPGEYKDFLKSLQSLHVLIGGRLP